MGGGAVHHLPDPEHHPYRRSSYPYVRQEDPHHPLAAEQGHLKMDQPMIVPTQHILPAPSSYYGQPDSRPGSSHSQMSNGGYMPQHHVMTVMHTDDAASKETQYLRRRCFNCHQTEPPSWRRSTLNPGKIVSFLVHSQ
jgi:GATA-binding protein, other eukaryote